jgi:hypothetical protein
MSDIVERLRSSDFASATDGLRSPVIWVKGTVAREAADEIEKLRAENERLANNARSDTRLLAAYHKWCDMHGCAPSSSDLSKARAALGEKE